jgi:hypothetical protein
MPSVELLKTLILDAQTAVPFTGIRRRLAWERASGKAFICVGVRRCGKSTLLAQIMAGLSAQGVPRENILYLNFFDERLIDRKRSELARILEAYFALYPHKQGKEKIHCFSTRFAGKPCFRPPASRDGPDILSPYAGWRGG